MRVTVDADRCTGHGRCYSLAPELFGSDEAGFCAQRGTTFDVPSGLAAAARTAASNCPEAAITVA